MQFVDTNIFIRYLTKDDPQKAAACYHLFERAKRNEVELTTSEAVLAEIVFILSSKRLYNLARQDIRIRLYSLLSLPGLKLPNRRQYLRALELYSNNPIDFEDALSVATMERQKIDEIYSYDKDFDRIKNSAIVRLEPPHAAP
jgi:predicted nucleic acid-binding protein